MTYWHWQKSLRALSRLFFRGAPAAACLAVLIMASLAASAQQPSSSSASDATLQLFEAVMEKDLARVQAAVTEGANITSENSWGLTATELAIDKGYFEIAHYLLSVRNFQQVNADRRRSTPRRDLGYLQSSAPVVAEPPAAARLGTELAPTARQAPTRQTTVAPPSPAAAPSPPPPPTSTAQDGKRPPTPPMASTAPRPKVIISRVGAEADSIPDAPAPPPSGQTAALPAKGTAPDENSKEESNVLGRVWSKLTDAFSFGGKDEDTESVPQTSVAVPQVAPKPPAPAETLAPTETTAPTKTAESAPQPILAAEAAGQGPAKLEPGAAAPRTPRPEALAQAPATDTAAPSGAVPTKASRALSPPPRERAEEAARAMNSLPRPQRSPVAVDRGPAPETGPKAAPEPASPFADTPRPEAPERAVTSAAAPVSRHDQRQAASSPETRLPVPAKESQFVVAKPGAPADDAPRPTTAAPESTQTAAPPRPEAPERAVTSSAAPAPRPDQRQAASRPETRLPVPAKESQFVVAKPSAPADDAPRPTPAAPESTQTEAAPAGPAPAAPVAARPAAEPARAAAPETEAAPEPNLLSRVWSSVTDSLGLGEPEETRQQQEAAPRNSAASENDRQQPPVTDAGPPPPVEQARLAAAAPARPLESMPQAPVTPPVTPPVSPHLKGVVLTLGTSLKLGQGLGPAESAKARCVIKNFWKAHFCLEAIDWPESIARIFEINTILYKGKQVIVRYDEGKATRFYALFPTESFADVAFHFKARFGPPTAAPKRVVAEFGAPRRDNMTVQWTSTDPASQDVNVLEVRAFDDASGVLPNFDLGVVELYRAGAPKIFGHLYTSDLMILRMKQSSPHALSSSRKSKSAPAKR